MQKKKNKKSDKNTNKQTRLMLQDAEMKWKPRFNSRYVRGVRR